ncbi:MAG: helix-turn-helix transcriptional regulator [Acidobacteriota bacterium]
MKDFKNIGMALRFLRTQRFQKQREVAKSAGITPAMLSAYETGKHRPSLETTERVLEALGCDVVDLTAALQHADDAAEEERKKLMRVTLAESLEKGLTTIESPEGEVLEITDELIEYLAENPKKKDSGEEARTTTPTPAESSDRVRKLVQGRFESMKLSKDEEAVLVSLIPGILAALRYLKKTS